MDCGNFQLVLYILSTIIAVSEILPFFNKCTQCAGIAHAIYRVVSLRQTPTLSTHTSFELEP